MPNASREPRARVMASSLTTTLAGRSTPRAREFMASSRMRERTVDGVRLIVRKEKMCEVGAAHERRALEQIANFAGRGKTSLEAERWPGGMPLAAEPLVLLLPMMKSERP